jgi:hypothetical protein
MLSIFAVLMTNSTSKKTAAPTSQDPTASLIVEAVKYINDSKETAKLADVAQRITQLSNYQSNPDLLYIVTLSAINMSDLSTAKSSLVLLKKIYKPSVGYSQALRSVAFSIDSLTSKVDVLAKQMEQFKKNTYGIAIPDGGQ